MKMLLSVLLFCSALCAQAAGLSLDGVKPAAIVDVRTPEEFAAGHIEGALNIPVERVGEGVSAIKGLNKESSILVYCRSGRRSAAAKATLEQLGYTHVVDGGAMQTLAPRLKPCTAKSC
ncbi:rhodanese-like domain-containing protein [Niveibacterium terrae]|uniref:rhodanese-like domain-containing protein n=1 Tax=Niveibacterium terrae TaxID=3373598 RepID=UPI003A91FB7D